MTDDHRPDLVPVRRALLSVSDKTGLVEFAQTLAARGIGLISTGGTAAALRAAGLAVEDVSGVTGFPEIMDGRVKTLHPKIHGGLLARRDLQAHRDAMAEHDIEPIDLLVVNLYPFRQTVAGGADFETCVENIDIGGPAMIRAAAKNHDSVTVVTDPADYQAVAEELERQDGCTGLGLRRRLAGAAYAHTAAYDAAIASWFAAGQGDLMPPVLTLAGVRGEPLRYGENPHQAAAFYHLDDRRPGVASARQLQGKALSYNNLNDTDAAFELVAEFERPAIAIIKHANPCGVAEAESLAAAWTRALACDPVSAFGGIVACNRPLDAATATALAGLFLEVVIAPAVDPEAAALLAERKNLRVLVTGELPDRGARGLTVRSIAGGLLVQERDASFLTVADLKIVTQRTPTAQEVADMLFAERVAKHVKSNAIVYAKDGATVGIGAGQMSRVDSSRIAALKAQAALGEGATRGSVVASDAFLPFADGLEAAVAAGATALIQPGGSIRDSEVIAAADAAGLAMIFTGVRHFRH